MFIFAPVCVVKYIFSKRFRNVDEKKPDLGLALLIPGEAFIGAGLVAPHEGVLEVLRDPRAGLLAGGVVSDEGNELEHGEDQADDQEDQEEQEGPICFQKMSF